MKTILTLIILMIGFIPVSGQVGINTENPQTIFHIDGLANNGLAAPSVPLQADDFVVTSDGNVGIGTTTPNASASLDVRASNKAIRITNVALTSVTDVTTVNAPQAGMIVFNTTDNSFYYFNGMQWVKPMLSVPNVVTPKLVAVAKSNNANATFPGGNIFYDNKIYDPENHFILGTSTASPATYTVAKSGLHQIFLNFSMGNITTGSAWYIRIKKNNAAIAAIDATAAAGASACLLAIDEFVVGDVITVDKGGQGIGWMAGGLSKISIFRFE